MDKYKEELTERTFKEKLITPKFESMHNNWSESKSTSGYVLSMKCVRD
jgi:hypothetical protein